MGMLMPAGILAVYDDARQFSDEVFASFRSRRRASPAPLTDLAPLVAQAEATGRARGRVTVNNPAMPAPRDADAQRADGVSYGACLPTCALMA